MSVNPIEEMRAVLLREADDVDFRLLTNDRRRFAALIKSVSHTIINRYTYDPEVRWRCAHLAGVIVADDPLEGMATGSLVVEFNDGRTYPLRDWNRLAEEFVE